MTPDEVKNVLDGIDIKDKLPDGIIDEMREHRLVGIWTSNGKNVYLFGQVNAIITAGKSFVIRGNHILSDDTDDQENFVRPVFFEERDDYGVVPLSFDTNTEHSVFTVLDDDNLVALGIIFKNNT